MSKGVRKSYDDPFTMIHNSDWDHIARHCRATTLLVWVALLRRANANTRKCHPSKATIAKEASVSTRTVHTAIQELEACGMLTHEQRWSEEGDLTSSVYVLHRAKLAEGSATDSEPVVQPLPNGSATVADKLDTGEPDPEVEPDISLEIVFFMEFWSLYPRKEGKADAQKAWTRAVSRTRPEVIIGALKLQMQHNWKNRDKKFIPLPATWIRGERWTDEIYDEVSSQNGHRGKDSGLSLEDLAARIRGGKS